ncbi:MAG: hypothetical protein WAR76_16400 [Xanthobacteraceae bacterium]
MADIGESAVELAHAVQRDCAIDIGAFKVWIELNRQIEIGDCQSDVALMV